MTSATASGAGQLLAASADRAGGRVPQAAAADLGSSPRSRSHGLDDIALARDYRGHFLVYNDTTQRIEADGEAEGRAIKIAEYREWHDRLDWEKGPDALHYPGLYDYGVIKPDHDAEDDLEPLDLEERNLAR